jgi:hypothetical protein
MSLAPRARSHRAVLSREEDDLRDDEGDNFDTSDRRPPIVRNERLAKWGTSPPDRNREPAYSWILPVDPSQRTRILKAGGV